MFDPSKGLKKMLGNGLQIPKMVTSMKNPLDWDGDGILNKFDCQPKNMFRQDKIEIGNNLVGLDTSRQKKLSGGGFCDTSIVPFIERINRVGFRTIESCSGLRSEHIGKHANDINKGFGGFLSVKNNDSRILSLGKGTVWEVSVTPVNSEEYRNFLYLVPESYEKSKIFRNGILKGRVKPISEMRSGINYISFMLPSNLSDGEILRQWEILTRRFEQIGLR